MAGGRKPSMAMYQGEMVNLLELAAAKGVTWGLVYRRWCVAGKPYEVNDDYFIKPIFTRGNPCGYTLDGVRMSARAAGAKLGVTRDRVISMAKRIGKNLTTADFYPAAAKQADPRKKVRHLDRSPGWWERENLPHAGKSGFNKVERGNFDGHVNRGGQSMPVYTG